MIGYLRGPQRAAFVAWLAVLPSLAVLCGGKSEKGKAAPGPAGKGSEETKVRVETLVTGLDIPWEVELGGDGRVFITERPGRVKIYDSSYSLLASQSVPGVKAVGEGGLLGMALHPRFSENRLVYLYLTYEKDDKVFNRVVRYVESGNSLKPESGDSPEVIFDAMPGSGVHNGGRIKFGSDGKLYIAAGDSAKKELAQDLSSPAGKIHRVNDDGTIPEDNPFPNSSVWSYGHRNPQGLTWDAEGRMYEAEHGPSGFDGPGGYDEANVIEKGKNYGWPKYGNVGDPTLVDPLFLSVEAVAPSGCLLYTGAGIAAWKGSLFLAMLRGQHLRRITLDPADPTRLKSDEVLFNREFGRLRAVTQGPDGLLYLLTGNRDGRAQTPFPTAEDDRLLRVAPDTTN